jgi:hypothetical protein
MGCLRSYVYIIYIYIYKDSRACENAEEYGYLNIIQWWHENK